MPYFPFGPPNPTDGPQPDKSEPNSETGATNDPLQLPDALHGITGIGKERLEELKARELLGLRMSDDEPMDDPLTGKVMDAMNVLHSIHQHARRFMRPADGKTPLEDKSDWKK